VWAGCRYICISLPKKILCNWRFKCVCFHAFNGPSTKNISRKNIKSLLIQWSGPEINHRNTIIVLRITAYHSILKIEQRATMKDRNYCASLYVCEGVWFVSTISVTFNIHKTTFWQLRLRLYTGVYPKVSGLAAWTENCKWYSTVALGAVVSLFYESG